MDDRGPVSELDVGSARVARLLRRGTMLVLGSLALCTAVPAMASASTPGWELNELPLTESAATAWKGNLKMSDSNLPLGGSVAVECETAAQGTAGLVNVGKVTSWTVSNCAAVTGCEKSTGTQKDTIEPLHLPWATELVTVEGQLREVAVNGGSGTPGFDLRCLELGELSNDECFGTINLTPKNVTGGISAEFGAGEKLKCAAGTNSGSLAGTQSIKASAGTLHTAEGLSLGWMRNGSQITEKSPATYYGTITLSDQLPSLGSVSVKCEDTGKGAVGAGANGEMTSWTMSNCTSLKGCEANTASIEAVNLPWHTELVTVEGALNDTFKTTENGFRLKCKDAGTSVTDTCPVVPHARITNSERDVTAKFNREKFTCIGGKSGTGELEGSQTIELSTGGDLWGA